MERNTLWAFIALMVGMVAGFYLATRIHHAPRWAVEKDVPEGLRVVNGKQRRTG